MNCPTDNTTLQLAERHGIEIDYCPACRGVWLDRGELDKIIERIDRGPAPVAAPARREDRLPRFDADYDYDDDDRYQRRGHGDSGRRRKRGGLLGELFDFGG